MIESLKDFPDNVLAFACRGLVTRADYEAFLVPAVEKALARHRKLRLYYEIGPDFAGIQPSAVLEDFKVGMEHISRWERIGVVTDVAWIGHTMRIFGFLLPGTLRVFPTAEASKARDWITGQ